MRWGGSEENTIARPQKHGRRRAPNPSTNSVRIIGGQWRNRRLAFADVPGLRPSGDRIRETLFNWLAPVLPGTSVLDLYAGSGALGIEAVSRGASHACLVECHAAAAKQLHASVAQLGAENISVYQQTAEQFLDGCPQQFDIVLLDPPFEHGLSPTVFETLQTGAICQPETWMYWESDKASHCPFQTPWQPYRQKTTGNVRFELWHRPDTSA